TMAEEELVQVRFAETSSGKHEGPSRYQRTDGKANEHLRGFDLHPLFLFNIRAAFGVDKFPEGQVSDDSPVGVMTGYFPQNFSGREGDSASDVRKAPV